jgi:hypothetical protein
MSEEPVLRPDETNRFLETTRLQKKEHLMTSPPLAWRIISSDSSALARLCGASPARVWIGVLSHHRVKQDIDRSFQIAIQVETHSTQQTSSAAATPGPTDLHCLLVQAWRTEMMYSPKKISHR